MVHANDHLQILIDCFGMDISKYNYSDDPIEDLITHLSTMMRISISYVDLNKSSKFNII